MRFGGVVVDYRRFAVVLSIQDVIHHPEMLLEVLRGIGPLAKRQMQTELRRVSHLFGYAQHLPTNGGASPERPIHEKDALDLAIALAVKRVSAIQRIDRL